MSENLKDFNILDQVSLLLDGHILPKAVTKHPTTITTFKVINARLVWSEVSSPKKPSKKPRLF